MSLLDPIVYRELPLIQKIIQDETWLEGERRGCLVPSGDPVVQTRVCEVILREGRQMREAIAVMMGSVGAVEPESPALLKGELELATQHAA